MSDTARDLKLTPATTTEGLDDLFADATQCEAIDLQCEAVDLQCEYTIIEASQVLKVSPSTIYRRVKAGRYLTVTDSDGVLKVIVPRIASQCEASASQFQTDATQCEAVDSRCETDATTDNELAKALIEMSHKLTHATYRNGWLESKLEELQKDIEQRDQHIKLLTDSQHKPKWWHRIRSWFAGQ